MPEKKDKAKTPKTEKPVAPETKTSGDENPGPEGPGVK